MTLRRLIRLGLTGAGAIALTAALAAFLSAGRRAPETWATLAAALAVVTAVIAAWSSQRVLELQEDAQEPLLSVGIDARRRYQLVQFRLANVGATPAHDIEILWEDPLLDADGNVVRVSASSDTDILPVLLAGESTAIALGASHRFFQTHKGRTFRGLVRYKNSSGASRQQRFSFSTEVHQRSLVHDEEEPKTLYELQKLPEMLQAIARELSGLRSELRGEANDGPPRGQ